MPKELIHFTIAERTAARLSDTRYALCLKKEPNALLLGAVLHDVLFYAVTPRSKRLEPLAHQLHGSNGQDSYWLIRKQAAHAAASTDNSLQVTLLVGLVSHLFADAVIHPMVYYFTGDYYAEAPKEQSLTRQRHRALESLMDMVACPEKIGRAGYLLRHLLRRCPDMLQTGLPMREIATKTGLEKTEAIASFKTAWRIFSTIQGLLPLPNLARSLFTIRKYLPGTLAEIPPLFYAPQLMGQASHLINTIKYIHPVTGKAHQTSLNDLMNDAAAQAEALCRRLEPTLFDHAEITIAEQGPTLDTGLPTLTSKDMVHYARPSFPSLD